MTLGLFSPSRTMTPVHYRPGSKGIFYYATEAGGASYPGGAAKPSESLALPGSPLWAGWSDVPEVMDDTGAKHIYGLGSRRPQTVIPGGHLFTLNTTTRIANTDLLEKCFIGSGGFEDLADLCLWTGVSGEYSDAMRYAKCNRTVFSFQSGSAQELTAQMEFWGITEMPGTILTPTNTQFGAYGTPLTWHNVMEISYGGVDFRDAINSITFTIDNRLERKDFRPDYGPASYWASVPYGLLPGQISYTANINWHSQNAKRRLMGILASGSETDTLDVVVSNVGSATEGSYSNGFTLSCLPGRIGQATRRGGDPAQELMSGTMLVLMDTEFTPLAP